MGLKPLFLNLRPALVRSFAASLPVGALPWHDKQSSPVWVANKGVALAVPTASISNVAVAAVLVIRTSRLVCISFLHIWNEGRARWYASVQPVGTIAYNETDPP